MPSPRKNDLIRFLARGVTAGDAWCLPATTPLVDPSPLRQALMPFTDNDGRAQLARWYYHIIRAVDWAWREMAEPDDSYETDYGRLPLFDSQTLVFSPALTSGVLSLAWKPALHGGPTTMAARLETENGVRLIIGGGTYGLTTVASAGDLIEFSWPEHLGMNASVPSVVLTGGYHDFTVRPRGFDPAALLGRLERAYASELNAAGLLDTLLLAPLAWEKLAAAWLAVYRNEG